MATIKLSVFDIFKIGPGPSSSHTIGPMRAGRDFLEQLKALPPGALGAGVRLELRLWGSLSLTGKGHGTDRALLAGLAGWLPDSIDSDTFAAIVADGAHSYVVMPGLVVNGDSILFADGPKKGSPHSNTITAALLDAAGAPLLEREYYSVGGGFIKIKGGKEPERPAPPYPYGKFDDIKNLLETNEARGLIDLAMENEKALSGASEKDIVRGLKRIVEAMTAAVRRGVKAEGLLPGPIGLARKAPLLHRRAMSKQSGMDRVLLLLNSYAMAASEENACGHIVVTAPTSGSAGVLPGIVHMLLKDYGVPLAKICQGLMVAALVGGIVKSNASIAGAEVGCQGEIGTASAMGAALLAHVFDYGFNTVENAAEIALEHHLGMTCDPVGGYVQIPCIERNAMGAVKAYNAYLLASAGNPKSQKVSMDEAVQALWETGKHMSSRYKETARGGLALGVKC